MYQHTGTPAEWQTLVLKSGGSTVAVCDNDDAMLGFYSPTNGMELHVVDNNPHSMAKGGGLEDTSLVKKYVMTDEEYDKRENTLRAYARERRKKEPGFKFFPKKKEDEADRPDFEAKECVEHVEVGKRCSVQPGSRRGEVAFVGSVTGLAAGYWVGVRFDEPVGKGDGTRGGVSYFEAMPKYGAFVRPHMVECGAFPPRDIMDELDSDSDDEGAAGAAGGAGGAEKGEDEVKKSAEEETSPAAVESAEDTAAAATGGAEGAADKEAEKETTAEAPAAAAEDDDDEL